MKFIQAMMMTNTMLSMWMKHPISMGTLLMIQSMLTSMLTILFTKNSWYSMILFVTFSSGLMIMFMYMSSISSNEKFYWSIKLTITIILILSALILTKMDYNFLFKHKWMEQMMTLEENEEKKAISKIISSNKILLFFNVTMLILISLVSISNLINSFEGPLKMTYGKMKEILMKINLYW
uniref:NADH dehydrogenase subunit 6 n=1 Tax=Laodelphax striatellus TaxID=195883 RepID=A0A4Y5UQI7_LAOST|nr:NADH dehydrogenase subunit 6 [Laodelphax striatellus]